MSCVVRGGSRPLCEKVVQLTWMHHDNLVNALQLFASASACKSAAEPHYRALNVIRGTVDCQHAGELATVDAVVTHMHVSAKLCAAQLPCRLGGLRRVLSRPN